MNLHKNIRQWLFLLLSLMLLAALLIFTGCQQQAAKKPVQPINKKPVALAPEVSKIKQEPTITLYRSATGQKQQLKMEEYIKGVVAAEIGPKFPMEALKAQAIVARTMTLALINYENGTRGKHGTDASDNHTEFQAYDEKQITDRISQAVEATRGQILTYNGKFVYGEFHSVSKNKTASIEESFPKLKKKVGSYIVPVKTNGMKYAPAKYRNWTVRVPRSEIMRIMGPKAGNLNDIRVSKKGPSGRALKVSAGSASIAGVDLRQQVGFDRLFSTYFTSIKAQGNYIVFKGSGWGHGAGMEQWGAYTMAKEGKKARQIVEHYYPATTWTRLYK